MKRLRNSFRRENIGHPPNRKQSHAGWAMEQNGKPQRSMAALYVDPDFFGPVPSFTPYEIVGGGWHNPPHVRFISKPPEWFINHPSTARAGAQRRAVRWLGRKIDRCPPGHRAEVMAWKYWRKNFLFPSWDPLHRHPNEDD